MQVQQPVRHALDAGVIDRLHSDACAEGRAEVALGQGRVVAVPVQMHAFTRTLVED